MGGSPAAAFCAGLIEAFGCLVRGIVVSVAPPQPRETAVKPVRKSVEQRGTAAAYHLLARRDARSD
jgi:hypothetical protein